MACAGAIASSEEQGTIEVVLGNPIPRWQFVVGNFAATTLSLLGGSRSEMDHVGNNRARGRRPFSRRERRSGAEPLLPDVRLLLRRVGALVLGLLHLRTLAVAIPALASFEMYLVDALGRLSEDLEDLRSASVYYYGSAIEDGIDWTSFAGVTFAALAFATLATLAGRRRDLYTQLVDKQLVSTHLAYRLTGRPALLYSAALYGPKRDRLAAPAGARTGRAGRGSRIAGGA